MARFLFHSPCLYFGRIDRSIGEANGTVKEPFASPILWSTRPKDRRGKWNRKRAIHLAFYFGCLDRSIGEGNGTVNKPFASPILQFTWPKYRRGEWNRKWAGCPLVSSSICIAFVTSQKVGLQAHFDRRNISRPKGLHLSFFCAPKMSQFLPGIPQTKGIAKIEKWIQENELIYFWNVQPMC